MSDEWDLRDKVAEKLYGMYSLYARKGVPWQDIQPQARIRWRNRAGEVIDVVLETVRFSESKACSCVGGGVGVGDSGVGCSADCVGCVGVVAAEAER